MNVCKQSKNTRNKPAVNSINTIPELLAPAGNLECLHAAVRAGADAVYLGLDAFNARRNAGNFSLETLKDACKYAHLRGVLVYVTLNVEILPHELQEAFNYALEAYRAGADALIVQDIGLAAKLTQEASYIPVHASTQMNIHNAAGIEAAAQLGMTRVTLARELSLTEIRELAEIATLYSIELECFTHGALCICYSGQCLLSSMIGGRSANRGLCAQPCRLAYELYRTDSNEALPATGEHLLSPRDLCSAPILHKLIEVGVASLKIEGRMKSPDYVYAVVQVYRDILDRIKSGKNDTSSAGEAPSAAGVPSVAGVPSAESAFGVAGAEGTEAASSAESAPRHATEDEMARLSEAFSRGFTTAYLEGQSGNEIMSYGRPNNRGVFIGRVSRLAEGLAYAKTELDLHEGDTLEFWTNKGHFTARLKQNCAQGHECALEVDKRTGKGDRVFRVRNSRESFNDAPFEPRIPLSCQIELCMNKPAHITFRTQAGITGEAWGESLSEAKTRALDAESVFEHVNRLGQTPFVLDRADFDIDMSNNVGMGFSQIHHLRAEAIEQLEKEILEAWTERKAARDINTKNEVSKLGQHITTGKVEVKAAKDQAGSQGLSKEALVEDASTEMATEQRIPKVCAWATNPGNARAAKRAGADAVYVPLLNFKRGQAQIMGVRNDKAEQAGYPGRCIMALPTVNHDPLPGNPEYINSFNMWDYVRKNKIVYADNLGDLNRALEMGALVESGSHVIASNGASLNYLAELGVKRAWLSPELSLGQIAALAENCPIELGIFISGASELMISEHCILASQGPCNEECETCRRRMHGHFLKDKKDYSFPVFSDMYGRSHLYNGIELDAIPQIGDFLDMGISSFMVDTTWLSKEHAEAAIKRAVRARDAHLNGKAPLAKRPNTTTGHLFRGVR